MEIEQYLINQFLEKNPDISFSEKTPGDTFSSAFGSNPSLKILACLYVLKNAEKELEKKIKNKSDALQALDGVKSKLEELQGRLKSYKAQYDDLKQLPIDHKVSQKLDSRYKKIQEVEKDIESVNIPDKKNAIEKAEQDIHSSREKIAGICIFSWFSYCR